MTKIISEKGENIVSNIVNNIDTGTGYGREPLSSNATLAEVGPGTPMGELMRRYWHPVARSESIGERPTPVRVLGEDLILFRSKAGAVGLLSSRCCHRGADLFYGRVEKNGLRCCYHGWLFDTHGHCLEQPCEPEGGKNRNRVRQPWYPVEERYGLVFAYMGPPDKKPVLPRYDALENLGEGEFYETYDRTHPSSGAIKIVPCNWLQYWENTADPFHVPILHISFSVVQFVPEFGDIPQVEWTPTKTGILIDSFRKQGDGRRLRRTTELFVPNARSIPAPKMHLGKSEEISWVVPVDDTHSMVIEVAKVNKPGYFKTRLVKYGEKYWHEMSEEEHQAIPGDHEVIVSQGPITFHSDEHLTTTDRGIVMIRRILREQMEVVASGGDPIGVFFEEQNATVPIQACMEFID